MKIEEVLGMIDSLRMAKQQGDYAPHKPLLLLYALGELSRGNEQLAFTNVDREVGRLLKSFGPQRAQPQPEFPFWWLQKDRLWAVTSQGELEKRKGRSDPKKSELVSKKAVGRFTEPVKQVLLEGDRNIHSVAQRVLDNNFPGTLHQDILDSVGLDRSQIETRSRRSPDFRRRVLRAYESQCCICGFDMRLEDSPVGLEAAHIMWKQARGPDEESNGLALCVLHHKLFDLGAFTVNDDNRTVVCSQNLSGSTNTNWLLAFHGKALRPPQSRKYLPKPVYLEWHRDTIFKGPPRDLFW